MSSVRSLILLAILCLGLATALPFDKFYNDVEITPYADTEGYRLITPIFPVSYDITLQPYLLETDGNKRFTFDGTVTIEVNSTESVGELKLHVRNLNITEKYVMTATGTKDYDLDITTQNTVTDIWTFKLNTNFTANVIRKIYFKYVGSMDDDMHGFYRSSYTDKSNVTK